MIQHKKTKYPSGFEITHDLAQSVAEKCERQEVTSDWYLSVGVDNNMQLFIWNNDQDHILGLDPWRMVDGPEDAPNKRCFVQLRDLMDMEYGVSYD